MSITISEIVNNRPAMVSIRMNLAVKNYPYSYSHHVSEPQIDQVCVDFIYKDDFSKPMYTNLYYILDYYIKRVCDGIYLTGYLDAYHEPWGYYLLGRHDENLLSMRYAHHIEAGIWDSSPNTNDEEEQALVHRRENYILKLPSLESGFYEHKTLFQVFESYLGDQADHLYRRLTNLHRHFMGKVNRTEYAEIREKLGPQRFYNDLEQIFHNDSFG